MIVDHWLPHVTSANAVIPQYTYYTLSAFSIRVPMFIKRTLTTLQITQFLVGAAYAMIHSFVSYELPVSSTIIKTSTSSPAETTTTSAVADTQATATPALLAGLKQLIFGVASKVTNAAATNIINNEASASEANVGPQLTSVEETVTETHIVPAIVTTGQTFAIWLNVLYLAPLTYLFVRFFITSYLRRSSAESKRAGIGRRESQVAVAEKAGWDAARSIEAEVYGTPDNSANGRVNGSAKGSTNGRVPKPATNQRSRYA